MCLVTQSCPTLCNPVEYSPPGTSVHGHSPGKNTGVGCRALLQGIFPTQGSNPGLPQVDSLPSEPSGKPGFNEVDRDGLEQQFSASALLTFWAQYILAGVGVRLT